MVRRSTLIDSSPLRVVITGPRGPDDVAEIDLVEHLGGAGLEELARAEQLDVAGPVADDEKHELAEAPAQDHAARDGDDVVGDLVGTQPGETPMQVGRVGGGIEPERERIEALGAKPVEALASRGEDLVLATARLIHRAARCSARR